VGAITVLSMLMAFGCQSGAVKNLNLNKLNERKALPPSVAGCREQPQHQLVPDPGSSYLPPLDTEEETSCWVDRVGRCLGSFKSGPRCSSLEGTAYFLGYFLFSRAGTSVVLLSSVLVVHCRDHSPHLQSWTHFDSCHQSPFSIDHP
jgi:hypothetical protein